MAKALLELRELSKYYTSTQSVVVGLDKLSLTFSQGEFVAITGESGSGKSTLAHVLAGILPYEGGELLFRGKPTSHYVGADWEEYRRDSVSFISQNYGILPGNTVLANVTAALRLVGMDAPTAKARAEEALKRVELWDLRRRRAAKLSSGQKQRLSIARALARPAPILIADEPTGNLDAENSAKVIQLLAEAAKDRLVILITHEFSECADYATRHISIHDGHVTMDQELRPPLPAEPQSAAHHHAARRGLSGTVAKLQLRSRPVWVGLMVLLFTMTVFAVFALAGTFIANLDDTPTRRFDNSAFRNGDNRRIVVVRPDGEDLTEEDHAALAGVKYVEGVDPWGYLSDIQYAWRPDVDYEKYGQIRNLGGGYIDAKYVIETKIRLKPDFMPFAKTVPIMADSSRFLVEGRLPENFHEVVAPRGAAQIGDTIPVYFSNQKDWSAFVYLYTDMTVVGLTDYGDGLYFHSEVGQDFTVNILWGMMYYPGDSYLLTDMLDPPHISFGGLSIPEDAQVSGRDPESIDEVFVVGPSSLIGTVLHAEFELPWRGTDAEGYTRTHTAKVERDLTVVGTATSAGRSVALYGEIPELWMYDRQLEDYHRFLADFDPLQEKYRDAIYAHYDYFNNVADYSTWPEDSIIFLNWSEENGGASYSEYVAQVKQHFAEYQKTEGAYQEYREKMDALCAQYPMISMNYNEVPRLSPYTVTLPLEDYDQFLADCAQLEGLKTTDPVAYLEKLDALRGAYLTLSPDSMMEGLTAHFPLHDDQILLPQSDYNASQSFGSNGDVFPAWTIRDKEGNLHSLTCVGRTESTYDQAYMLNDATYYALGGGQGGSDQASLTIRDYAYADRVLKAVRELGYIAVSPYQEGAGVQYPALAEQRMQTLRICLIALLVAIVLHVVVLRAMFSLETESYRLMGNIGLNCSAAKLSVFWQVLAFTLGGQLLGAGAVFLCGRLGQPNVVQVLKYLTPVHWAVLSAVHILACLLTALWIMRALEKNVFPGGAPTPDLDWDAAGEEVEA